MELTIPVIRPPQGDTCTLDTYDTARHTAATLQAQVLSATPYSCTLSIGDTDTLQLGTHRYEIEEEGQAVAYGLLCIGGDAPTPATYEPTTETKIYEP